jgi:hypothetical protein
MSCDNKGVDQCQCQMTMKHRNISKMSSRMKAELDLPCMYRSHSWHVISRLQCVFPTLQIISWQDVHNLLLLFPPLLLPFSLDSRGSTVMKTTACSMKFAVNDMPTNGTHATHCNLSLSLDRLS